LTRGFAKCGHQPLSCLLYRLTAGVGGIAVFGLREIPFCDACHFMCLIGTRQLRPEYVAEPLQVDTLVTHNPQAEDFVLELIGVELQCEEAVAPSIAD